jgi:TolB-like protein
MAAVWSDAVVSDESLTKCISEVRAALGDRDQRLVKTVPRRGYVFDTLVAAEPVPDGVLANADAGRALPSARAGARRRRGVAVAVLIVAIVAATLAVAWRRAIHSPFPDRPSIAVLPFRVDEAAGRDYFSDGLTDDLITSLGRFRELFVIGRDSSFTYARPGASAQQIGRDLGVRYLVQGSVRQAEQVRVTASLVDAESGRQLWGESYDRTLASVFTVQDDVTQSIVRSLVAHVDRAELARTARIPPPSFAAYDLYLADGRFAHLLVHDGHAPEAVVYMQRMMRQDPLPPPIYLSYLGNAYYMNGQYDDAYATLRRGTDRMPDYRALWVWLAAAAGQSGRRDEARTAAQQVLAMAPRFTTSAWLRHINFERQADADRLAEGLRKAGLPSGHPQASIDRCCENVSASAVRHDDIKDRDCRVRLQVHRR